MWNLTWTHFALFVDTDSWNKSYNLQKTTLPQSNRSAEPSWDKSSANEQPLPCNSPTQFDILLCCCCFLTRSYGISTSIWTSHPGPQHMPGARFADNKRTTVSSAPLGLPTVYQKKGHSYNAMLHFLSASHFLQFPLWKNTQLFIKCLYLEVLLGRQKKTPSFSHALAFCIFAFRQRSESSEENNTAAFERG